MLRARLLLPLALLSLTTACATSGTATRAPRGELVLPRASTDSFLADLDARLKAVGFETERAGDILKAEHGRTYSYFISYDDLSSRLVHIAFFGMEPGFTCATADVKTAIAEANRQFNLGKVYCDTDDDTIGYEGTLLIPQNGIAAEEIRDYLAFLSQQMRVMAVETGLWDLMK